MSTTRSQSRPDPRKHPAPLAKHRARKPPAAPLRVETVTSYNVPQPQIVVTRNEAETARQFRARLHIIAAAVEVQTLPSEDWLVRIEVDSDMSGRICLELAEGDALEAHRGEAMLKRIVEGTVRS